MKNRTESSRHAATRAERQLRKQLLCLQADYDRLILKQSVHELALSARPGALLQQSSQYLSGSTRRSLRLASVLLRSYPAIATWILPSLHGLRRSPPWLPALAGLGAGAWFIHKGKGTERT